MEPLVNRRTKLVSVAWVSHQNGFRHDMRPIADLAHAHGAFFYTDGIQGAGMFPMDVKAAGVDAMCVGTYKWLLGAYGVAPFYVRRELLDRIRLDRYGALHVERQLGPTSFEIYKTARRFDYATLAFGPVYQLGAGLEYLKRVGVDRIETHTVALAHQVHKGLRTLGFDSGLGATKRQREMKRVERMMGYAYARKCRRRYVRECFGEAAAIGRCGGCYGYMGLARSARTSAALGS